MQPTPEPLVLLPLPPVPPNEIFSIKIIGNIEGQLTVSSFHYRNAKPVGSSTRADLIDLATAFVNLAGPQALFADACSSDWYADHVSVFSPTNASLLTYDSPSSAVQGAGPAGALAAQSCVTIQKRTLFRGKHGRGRISVPAVPRAWAVGTVLTLMAAHKNLAEIMSAPLTGAATTYTPGVLCKGLGPTVNYGWVDMLECRVNETLGTCRRRKPGVGK